MSRINKIQLQNDISLDCKDFELPRMKTYSQDVQKHVVYPLPSKTEICYEIENCEKIAIKFAIKIGLRSKEDEEKPVTCGIKALVERNWYVEDCIEETIKPQPIPSILGNILLTDFSDKFLEKPSEVSLYVELFCGPKRKRMVVKKSSLCWLLRTDTYRVSSDRIQRVRIES